MFSTACWQKEPTREADGSITAETVIEADDPWFEGHFPGEPLLPAVAQLSLAWEAVRLLESPDAELAGFRRVKFKEMIRPGHRLTVTARPTSVGKYAFRMYCAGRLACTGSLVLRGGLKAPEQILTETGKRPQ